MRNITVFFLSVENPLLENREEQELGNDIERDLHEVLTYNYK